MAEPTASHVPNRPDAGGVGRGAPLAAAPPGLAGPPAGGASGTDWAIYRRLFGYVSGQWPWFLLVALGFLLTAAGEAGFAAMLGWIVDSLKLRDAGAEAVLPGGDWAQPWMFEPASFFIALLVLAVLRGVGTFIGEYVLARISVRAIHAIRCALFDCLMLLPSAYYDDSARGHLVSRLTFTAAQLHDTTTDAMRVLVADGLRVVVFVGFLAWVNWLLTLVLLALVPTVAAIVRFAAGRFRRISERIQSAMGDVTHVASEAVAGYREVKIFGGEDYERRRFGAASDRNRRQSLKMAATKAASAQTIQLLAAVAVAVLVFLIYQPSVGADMSAGDLVWFISLAGALANPIKKLSDVNARLQRGLAAAEDIFAQLDQPAEADEGDVDADRVRGEICFENVSFGYGDGPPVLIDVSFSVQPGQTVAVVGDSGAGKSTLASLIARFYEPASGSILLDGEPLGRYRLASLRRQIALVRQNIALFNGTLEENIAYGSLAGASRQAIDDVVRRAHAEAFIDRLPAGLNTVVGDDGVRLSGGQRQRIAIARALLKDAPVLILDEATSALDARSERHIQEALEEAMRGRTTLVIAHRLSTIEKADLILVVSGGRVVERGRHAELMAADGVYAELYRTQFETAEAPAPPPPAPEPVPGPLPADPLGPLVRAWYDGSWWPRLLRPLAAVLTWLARRRRRSRSTALAPGSPPVIVVGNIAVGGTGKTPLVIWLARWFRSRGLRAGVVSRGYGGKASYPLLVTEATLAEQCGDEAAMIARRVGCPVVVDPNRVRAVAALTGRVDVVIADDGLQHYALARQVEIAVVDGLRGAGNGLCLPAGPLREPVSRLAECDWVVANGAASSVAPGAAVMVAEATAVVNVRTGERLSVQAFAAGAEAVVAVAGVGNPARFAATLARIGLQPALRAFPDHHAFSLGDLQAPVGADVVVTEKDAEKIKALDGLGDNVWYVEIDMRFEAPVDDFLEALFAQRGIAVSGTAPIAPTATSAAGGVQ